MAVFHGHQADFHGFAGQLTKPQDSNQLSVSSVVSKGPLCQACRMVENLSYTAVGLDRAAHLRRDEAWIDARLTDPTTRVAPLWQSLNLIDARSAEPKAVFLSAADGEALVS